MSFFQNPFAQEFKSTWVVVNGSMGLPIIVPPNVGRSDSTVIAYGNSPYNFSGNDGDGNSSSNLTIWFSTAPYFTNWNKLVISLGNASSNTAAAVVSTLNANATFAARFRASLSQGQQVEITAKAPFETFKFYIANGGAEEKLLFNKFAGVNDIPSYYDRHKICHYLSSDEKATFKDNLNMLVSLSDSSTVEKNVIENAVDARGVSLGFIASEVKSDYEFLNGESEQYIFKKITLDTAGNIAQIIEFPAGSKVGDMARKTCYYRNGGALSDNPYQITQVPYVLQEEDLIIPDCTEATDNGEAEE